MRNITIGLYSINELSTEAQQKAYQQWSQEMEYPFHDDNINTLQTFLQVFDFVTVEKFEYEFDCSIDFFIDDNCVPDITGLRLHKWIVNNYDNYLYKNKSYFIYRKQRTSKIVKYNSCVLTGYYQDDIILYHMYKYLEHPTSITLYDLMKKCLTEWVKACKEDFDHCSTFEYFVEESQANEWEYTANGELYQT